MRESQGVTLVELIVVLAIAAVLLGLAAPGFGELRRDQARASAVNDLLHVLLIARSEAIMRARVVSVCRSSDGARCSGREVDWAAGWLVFVNEDAERPPQVDAGEPVLRVHAPVAGLTIRSNREAFSFRPVNQFDVNGTIVFCDDRGTAAARAIIVSHTGRPRVSQRDASNRPLTC
jgi:type IV fimbrial biogenesis protein FimT